MLTSHELTQRQAAELAALVADSDPAAVPGPLGEELCRFAGPADAVAVRLVVDEPPANTAVAFTGPATDHLAELLDYGLAQRLPRAGSSRRNRRCGPGSASGCDPVASPARSPSSP